MALWEWIRDRGHEWWQLLRTIGRVLGAWLEGILHFLRDSGAFVLNCLLSVLNRIGHVSSGFAKEWLRIAGIICYGIVPCFSYGGLLYVWVSRATEESLGAWFALVFSQLVAVSWVCRWLRVAEQPPSHTPKAFPGEYYTFFYLFSTFVVLVTSFAGAYMAAAKVGGNVSGLAESFPGFWEYMRFSILTATTLGQSGVTTGGISSFVECAEVIQFWLFVVVAGWRLKPQEASLPPSGCPLLESSRGLGRTTPQ